MLNRVMTVSGPVPSAELGWMLPHEHILVDFAGAETANPARHNPDEVFAVALPHLLRAHALGFRTFVDCTPAYLGRDVALLRRLAESSGLHILTNTGYYGAGGDKFVPRHATDETADQLAARWINEWRDGIDGTGIRPGFIKTAVDDGPLSPTDRKLVIAAARTHLATGLPIACHTTDATAIRGAAAILDAECVPYTAFIWVHAHTVNDPGLHADMAMRGMWIEFDGLADSTVETHVALIRQMRDRGFLNRVLVSHDAGWYSVGEVGGGPFRGFETLPLRLVPALRENGFTGDELDNVLATNPGTAFSVRSPAD